MAIIMNSYPAQEQSEQIISLRDGLYIPESILNVTDRHALLWGCQSGINRHIVIERLANMSQEEADQALYRAPAVLTIDHENLARCIDIFYERNALYIVMVTGEGTPLYHYSPSLSQSQALEAGIEICNALNYLNNHTEFAHHGAIQPQTVFRTLGGRIKLTNLVALLSATHATDEEFCWYNAREDVFGVGATIHYALTGWQGNYRQDTPPLDLLNNLASPELCQVIGRALAIDPADRWANAAELRYALLKI
jgi:serine/threonine protein kinase